MTRTRCSCFIWSRKKQGGKTLEDKFMNEVTDEMMEKAKAAASAEELLKLAKEAGVEMTEESAKEAFSRLHPSEKLSIDDLDDVSRSYSLHLL